MAPPMVRNIAPPPSSSARQALADFWTELGRQGPSGGVSVGQGDSFSLSPASKFLANWAGHFSPALFNPQDVNPLRDLLEQQVDFERLRQHSPFKLFVGATHANSGKLRVFREHELTLDALMASACLPRLSRTVTIDGQPYWDGGYAANPPVTPLLLECSVGDVMLVLLDPLEYPGVPQQVADIDLRLIDLAFATNLRREMQWLDQARSLLGEASASGGWLERRLRHAHFHQIDTQHLPQLHKSETKLLVHGPFLQQLMRHGQEAAQTWLQQHGQDLGKRSSMDWTTWR